MILSWGGRGHTFTRRVWEHAPQTCLEKWMYIDVLILRHFGGTVPIAILDYDGILDILKWKRSDLL